MNTILVIEDNNEIRENTAEILQLAGYKTFTAENGKTGVETALRETPDLIVCDIMMPVLDGYGVLHLLNKNDTTKNIPFIFLSAKSERTDLRKGMEMGADDYITKPFEEIELLNAIEVRLKKKSVLNQEYANNASGVGNFLHDLKETGLVNHLKDQYDIVKYSKKQFLYQESNRPRFVYFVVKGKLKSIKIHEDGKEYIQELFGEGDFIGHLPIIEDRNYDESVIVLENAEVLQLPKEDFMQMMNAEPAVLQKFVRLMTKNIREKEERLLTLAYSSLRKRVAKALLDIDAKYNKDSGANAIDISRDDIAHYVGTATESLIRTLSDFKQEKLVNIIDGRISIANRDKLRNLIY
ncbi:MAG: response regulator [Chitinophagaceae bacterium]|nr:response regulator [Chitinophagaceae bacterium]